MDAATATPCKRHPTSPASSPEATQQVAEQASAGQASDGEKLKAAIKNLTDYMEAGMKAGFIFGVSKVGVTVEHDPKTSLELAWVNVNDLERQLAETRGIAGALRRRLHIAEKHNQYFFRCESAWCNPSPDNDPALYSARAAGISPEKGKT